MSYSLRLKAVFSRPAGKTWVNPRQADKMHQPQIYMHVTAIHCEGKVCCLSRSLLFHTLWGKWNDFPLPGGKKGLEEKNRMGNSGCWTHHLHHLQTIEQQQAQWELFFSTDLICNTTPGPFVTVDSCRLLFQGKRNQNTSQRPQYNKKFELSKNVFFFLNCHALKIH